MIKPVACRNCPKVEELQSELAQANEALQRYREGVEVEGYSSKRIIELYSDLPDTMYLTEVTVLVMRKKG